MVSNLSIIERGVAAIICYAEGRHMASYWRLLKSLQNTGIRSIFKRYVPRLAVRKPSQDPDSQCLVLVVVVL